ncbi:Tetratricopeptide repeat superfamily protein [Perilla frutescens var. hirtella]|nr:Tetratricopeptide repeat superfamily protein [Perilla frutescens var. hirtella]
MERPETPFLTLDMMDKFLAMALPEGAMKDHPITCPMGEAAPPLEKVKLPPYLYCVAEDQRSLGVIALPSHRPLAFSGRWILFFSGRAIVVFHRALETRISNPLKSCKISPKSIPKRSRMEAKINQFFESVTNFFGGGDKIPYSTPDVILGCEREVAEAKTNESDDRLNESIMRLSWALTHSRQPEDVQRGIAMLEDSLTNAHSTLQKREKLYLLAVGFYRSGDYPRSRHYLDQCLMIAPDWRQALSLKEIVEERITKDGVIGIGIAATAVGLIASGIAAALARRG